MDLPQPPAPRPKPKLARFLWERDLLISAVAPVLGCTPNSLRRYCLAFDDPERQVPRTDTMERICAWTRGEVTPADFYPPHLSGAN